MKNIVALLQKNDLNFALVEMERLIVDGYRARAVELLRLDTEHLLSALGLIDSQESLDPSLTKALRSVAFCGDRIEIEELKDVVALCRAKFGEAIDQLLVDPEHPEKKGTFGVRQRLQRWLSYQPPSKQRVRRRLAALAQANGVQLPEGPASAASNDDDGRVSDASDESDPDLL